MLSPYYHMTRPTPPRTLSERLERAAPALFILPAVLIVLLLSLFPLIFSLYLSLSRLKFEGGGLRLDFVGFDNYRKYIFGNEQKVLVGAQAVPTILGWIIFVAVVGWFVLGLVRNLRNGRASVGGVIGRLVNGALLSGLTWLVVSTLFADGGRPGALVVTLMYVLVGVTLQYVIGLGLALLCTQQLRGRRFFRVLFLLPMMITPVGVGYLFMTPPTKGHSCPCLTRSVWKALRGPTMPGVRASP